LTCHSTEEKFEAVLSSRTLLKDLSDLRECDPSSPSTFGDLEVEQRAVLLTAEDVGIARAPARNSTVYRELDRQCRVERDMAGDLLHVDAEDRADGRGRQDAALANPVIGRAVGKDYVEGDLVDAGVLAADRLGDLGKFPPRHQTPASTMQIGN